MRKMIISMGYGLAYLAVIGFYSYLKQKEQEDNTKDAYQNQEKRHYQASPVRILTKKKIAKRNSVQEGQSHLDSMAQQKKKMRYN